MNMTSSHKKENINGSSIPYVKPHNAKNALNYIQKAIESNYLQGDGPFTKKCHLFLEEYTKSPKALLTHSGTAALEMTALLIDLKEGDEVIMPSYTFSSTANAIVLRGATPVFVDIREDTLNIDENLIEAAITTKTKAILPVHYAGVAANMDIINRIAEKHNLFVIEDAAQALGSFYKGKPLGTLGDFGAYSFHATKNIIAGEGGALLIRDPKYIQLAEIIREKGTNRSQFIRGEVDKYTWQEKGSSFLPSEITAALLLSQLEEIDEINTKRLAIWNAYHEGLKLLEDENHIVRPFIPEDCTHTAHLYYIIVKNQEIRDDLLQFMKEHNVLCVSHYVPLHSAPAGLKYGRTSGNLDVTDKVASQIVRLPLWSNMTSDNVDVIQQLLTTYFRS